MTLLARSARLVLLAAVASLPAASLQAQSGVTLYWQGGVGALTDANYTDGTLANLTPASGDVVYFGAVGTGTLTGPGTTEFYRLRIGHNEAVAGAGTGEVTVSGGAILNMIGGDAGTANSGLTVGNINNGLLVIDGAGTTVTSSRLIVIGVAPNQPSRNGTIRITNGGSLIAADGNINVGLAGGTSNGMQGHLIVENGTVTALGSGADMNIGSAGAMSSFSLASGSVQIADVVQVATASSLANNNGSSFTMSGGTFSNGGNFFVGRGASVNATLNLSGGELSVGNRFLAGSGTATGVTINHTGGVLTTTVDVRVADAATVLTADSTYNLSGTGVINSAAGGIVGRQGTGRFFQTGGVANFSNTLSIGNREAAAIETNGLYKISAGELNAGAMTATTALSIAPNGTGEFRVVGDDASIDLFGNLLVNNTANGVGTLAYEFETGDSLSTINVTDAATFSLGSRLVLDTTNAAPTQASYDLLTALSIDDQGIDFSGPTGWSYQIVAGGNGQILRVTGPGGGGDNADFDNDGDVDGADFLAWQQNVDKTTGATRAQGDANGDGAVNGADLSIWRGQFGPAAAASAAAIPEPATALLVLIGLGAFAARRRAQS
jgi:hypothetical protein